MVWMQNFMKSNLRRRQSQSPSSSSDTSSKSQRSFFGSKHKRRAMRKDSSGTEGSSCSGNSYNSDSASWRVENIRKAPPRAEEWWEVTATESNESKEYEEEFSDDGHAEEYDTIVIKPLSQQKRFHNCGLETWQRARREWNKRTVDTLPPKPTPAEYSQLAKGLKKASGLRTYELPRQMALSDLIEVYNHIWDGDGM